MATSRVFDAYLNFRGPDTRHIITCHLYKALVQAGVTPFIDSEDLERGAIISQQLTAAIQRSRISVIIFSSNYASSAWCLDELVSIMECWKTQDKLVLPVFYHVDPSDVRKQKGSFAVTFKKHSRHDSQKLLKWREALTQAANISGWDTRNER